MECFRGQTQMENIICGQGMPKIYFYLQSFLYMSQRLQSFSQALSSPNRLTQLRKTSKINKEELLNVLIPTKLSRNFKEVFDLIRDNPIFQHASIEEFSRQQERAMDTKPAMLIMNRLKINLEEDQYRFLGAMYAINFFGIGPAVKSLVQYLLYTKTLLVFRSNSYHQECLDRANKLQDLGSFSLTELHHGSFSKGIATEAVYDHSSKEFIINSHGEKGMKFWIGNTAHTANRTVVWAQLIVEGVNYGPHCFVMPLRDDKTHQVLPGLTVGDCGPKNGLNAIDNGYIIIKDVRVPINALLGKLGYVDEKGKYQSKIQSNEQRFGLHMSPLSNGRAAISFTSLSQSIAALTIALRYACERSQFKSSESQPETLIIDYPTTRYRLMVPLAINIVYYFAGVQINEFYIENSENFTNPSHKIVSQLHAVSAVLKAKTSWFTSSAITECREVLGGHGFSAFSGLKKYYHDNDVNSTWEGDNNMLLQQTSKYLLKAIKSKDFGSVLNLSFFEEGVQSLECSEKTLNNLPQLRALLQSLLVNRHTSTLKEMSKVREEGKKKGVPKEDLQNYIWNSIQPYFCNQMALSYGDLVYFESMYRVLHGAQLSEPTRQFLITCLKIFAHSTLLKASIDSLATRRILQSLIVQQCEIVYQQSVAVTDILCAPSLVVGSPFAQEDGQGMKAYINLLFSGKQTFGRVEWYNRLLKLKNDN